MHFPDLVMKEIEAAGARYYSIARNFGGDTNREVSSYHFFASPNMTEHRGKQCLTEVGYYMPSMYQSLKGKSFTKVNRFNPIDVDIKPLFNPVKMAYLALSDYRNEYTELLSSGIVDLDKYKANCADMARKVFRAVAEVTDQPGVAADVERGHYDNFYLIPSTMCYLQSNWRILHEDAQHCTHCGRTH